MPVYLARTGSAPSPWPPCQCPVAGWDRHLWPPWCRDEQELCSQGGHGARFKAQHSPDVGPGHPCFTGEVTTGPLRRGRTGRGADQAVMETG